MPGKTSNSLSSVSSLMLFQDDSRTPRTVIWDNCCEAGVMVVMKPGGFWVGTWNESLVLHPNSVDWIDLMWSCLFALLDISLMVIRDGSRNLPLWSLPMFKKDLNWDSFGWFGWSLELVLPLHLIFILYIQSWIPRNNFRLPLQTRSAPTCFSPGHSHFENKLG